MANELSLGCPNRESRLGQTSNTGTIPIQCSRRCIVMMVGIFVALAVAASANDSDRTDVSFDTQVQPILAEYCYGCHADGANEGSLSFDSLLELSDEHQQKETWHRVLKQLRADLMPPRDEDQPSDEQLKTLEIWIIQGGLGLDVNHPQPGKVTVRRLNRVEYRNTIRDLLGVDYDTSVNFPADNTGHGFDNIADVSVDLAIAIRKVLRLCKRDHLVNGADQLRHRA